MVSARDLSPAAQRVLAAAATRRSLDLFHEESFAIMHGGERIIRTPHTRAMVHKLEQLASGEITRLVINLPPRHGKSELTSGSFPAWLIGHDPTVKVVVASYGLDLSKELIGNVRRIVKHPNYARYFPKTVIAPGQDRQEYFRVRGGGSVRAASKEGAITGLGTHFLIVDDFHKAGETLSPIERERALGLFRTSFVNRFDNLNDSRIVIVMQRLHEDDLSGWALRTGRWDHLNLPAFAEQDEDIPLPRGEVWHRRKGDVLAPAIASAEYLEEQRAAMGARDFGAQFQGDPTVADGALIDINLFGQYDERPERNFFHKIVQSCDPAATDRITSDYSVVHTYGFRDGDWYLLDVIRQQLAFGDLCDRVIASHKRWRTDALIIEGASIGHSLYDMVRRAKLPGLLRCPTPRLSKVDRVASCAAQLRSGNILLPTSADWLPDLRHELKAFPDGRNDDHVDAMTQFLEFAFAMDKWVHAEFDENGRRMRPSRPEKKPRYYDGDTPSGQSWSR